MELDDTIPDETRRDGTGREGNGEGGLDGRCKTNGRNKKKDEPVRAGKGREERGETRKKTGRDGMNQMGRDGM